ncbi:hypothetical protein LMH73_011865 [Vibrio splendidus]|nr:hypothetical protein [Vibrio splendidus]MCC4881554.1 hypothetical protein [Vibrio splendidus]
MQNLFEQLKANYQEAKKENPDFLKIHSDDFYIQDKDVLENDTQAGDHYIAVLKGSGAGTHLNRCSSKDESNNYTRITVGDAYGGSRFFHIECAGHNKGTVTEVSQNEALKIACSHQDSPSRVSRRMSLNRRLESILGLDPSSENTFSRLSHTTFSGFTGNDGEISAIKISADRLTGNATLEVARTRVSPENESAKMHAQYTVPLGIQKMADFIEPKYFKAETKVWPYAEMTEITKRVFDNAKKKAITPKESALSL